MFRYVLSLMCSSWKSKILTCDLVFYCIRVCVKQSRADVIRLGFTWPFLNQDICSRFRMAIDFLFLFSVHSLDFQSIYHFFCHVYVSDPCGSICLGCLFQKTREAHEFDYSFLQGTQFLWQDCNLYMVFLVRNGFLFLFKNTWFAHRAESGQLVVTGFSIGSSTSPFGKDTDIGFFYGFLRWADLIRYPWWIFELSWSDLLSTMDFWAGLNLFGFFYWFEFVSPFSI